MIMACRIVANIPGGTDATKGAFLIINIDVANVTYAFNYTCFIDMHVLLSVNIYDQH